MTRIARIGVALWVVFVVVVVVGGCGDQAPTVPSGNEALYEDPNYAPDTDQDGDVPKATFGSYTFNSTSHLLANPYVALKPNSAGWVFREWFGSPPVTGGGAMILDASYGGMVRGVKTLRIRRVAGGDDGYEDELIWFAQDTAGNVHWLNVMVLAA